MLKKSVKLNAVLNVIKSLLSVIFPLISYPYVTRVLGVENLGKINYGSSIITYFSLFAAFGITSYAIREGSKIRDDKKAFNRLSSELFSINLITTLISYCLLAISIFAVHRLENYRLLIALQSLTIIFTTLGVDWINTIYEDYLYITIRGIATNLISLIALFLFVKSADDYYIYAMLVVLSNAVVCLWNYFYCKKYVRFKLTVNSEQKKHIKKMSVFFVNSVAVSVYVGADIIMLGWMVGDYSVGIYSVAVKIYAIMKLVLAAIYSVTLPRLSYFVSHNKDIEYRKLITKVISAILILLLPAVAALLTLSREIVLVIGGENFIAASSTLKILSIALLFAILGGIITQCINISLGLEKINAQATIVSALENMLLNIPFIMVLHENGAAITTAISELTVLIFCVIKGKQALQNIDKKSLKVNLFHSLIGVLTVTVTSFIVHALFSSVWMVLISAFVISISIYAFFLILLKNDLTLGIVHRVIGKVKKQ